MQSEPSDSASNINAEQKQENLANFKPEPSEQPQETPLANNDSQNSTPKSFGDLLSDNNPAPSTTPSVTQSPQLDQSTPTLTINDQQPTTNISL